MTTTKNKPSDACRLAGLDSFAELVRITEMPENTLLRWFKTKPQAFKILVQGASCRKVGRDLDQIKGML